MNAEGLLAHYERIADAPDAIGRLRQLILRLAVCGKLVRKNQKEEPASELLRRFVNARPSDFREPTNAVNVERSVLPFVVPIHWEWARLIDIAKASYGFAFPSGQFNGEKRGMPLIRIRDISSIDTETYFDGEFESAYLVTKGDYLVGMDGDFNLRRWQGKDALLNQRVLRINAWKCGVDSEYVKVPLQFILDYLHGKTSFATVKHLSAKQVNGIEIPLPPLEEQHRIVAKVDELMALCDRLEAARGEREAARDRLSAASLARLNAPDLDTFQADARFALNALPALTTRPDQIKQLRQTILNLAVRGKLVPQDPKDESAADVIGRLLIARRRAFELESGKAMKDYVAPEHEDGQFDLPRTWAWASALELCHRIEAGSTPPAGEMFEGSGEIPFIKVYNLTFTGKLDFGLKPTFIAKTTHDNKLARSKIFPGDVLMNIVGPPLGKVSIVPSTYPEWNTNQAVVLFRPLQELLPNYLAICLRSSAVLSWILDLAQQTVGQLNISVVKSRRLPLPIPPLDEQHRIVAKVDELMALCDQLEASLNDSTATRGRLLESLLAKALSPDDVHDSLAVA